MKKTIAIILSLAMAVTMFATFDVRSEETTQVTTKVSETTKAPTPSLPKSVTNFMKRKTRFTAMTLVNKKKIDLKWKKMTGAKGYAIYRKTNKGKMKFLKSVKKLSTSDTNVKYGTTYRYYIRGYMKYNKKSYYSNYNKKGYKKVFKVKKVCKKGYTWICDMNGNKIKNVGAFLNKPKYCLRVNVVKSVMTVLAKDGKRGYKIPVKAYLCAGNTYDTAGTYKLGAKYRFRGLYYNCHSQWSARIYEDILFHTVPYKKSQNPNSLNVKEYNKLGTPSSHGCIRLQCVAAKFIYDKCKVGTRVVITKSKKAGPLGKPKLEKLKKWHTWDPTDPTMAWKCKKHKCKHKKY